MVKDKSSKRKKLSSNVTDNVEEMMDIKVKKKKRKMEVEEAPVIPDETITTSDIKQKKKKKTKKTKQTEAQELDGEEDLTPEERLVMVRKMKKILKKEAKKSLKAEGETVQKAEVSGPIAPQQALDYLTCWAKNRTEWKFQKTRQTWLLQHMFDFAQISDETFSVLLEYMVGLHGGAKDTTIKKALVLIEESGQAPEDKDIQQRAHRAREVIQLLA